MTATTVGADRRASRSLAGVWRVVGCILAFAPVWTAGGCTSYRLVDKVENGGDAPPFATAEQLKAGDVSNVGTGDAVAYLGGSIDDRTYSNTVRIDLVVPIEPDQQPEAEPSKEESKQQAAEDEPSKEESKQKAAEDEPSKEESKQKAAEDEPSKEEAKQQAAEDEPSKEEAKQQAAEDEPSKEEAKQQEQGASKEESKEAQPSKEASKQPPEPAPCIGMMKHVKKEADTEWVSYLQLIHGQDTNKVLARLLVYNWGTGPFSGRVEITDRLSPKIKFLRTVRVEKVEWNQTREFVSWLPYVQIIALDMDYFAYQPTTAEEAGLKESLDGDLLKYTLEKFAAPPQNGLAVVFEIEMPDWAPDKPLPTPEAAKAAKAPKATQPAKAP